MKKISIVTVTLFIALNLLSPVYASKKKEPVEIPPSANVWTEWQGRGLVALIKLDELKKKFKLTKKEQYEFMVETAYSLYVKPDSEHKVRTTEDNYDFYKVAFAAPTTSFLKGEKLFVINYIYDRKSGAILGEKVDLLPKNWQLRRFHDDPETLVLDLRDDNLAIYFSSNDPLHARVDKLIE